MAERQPKNLNELKVIIIEVWNIISKEMCEKYTLSFNKRALVIYRAKDDHIDY
jgi:hypothetical protein